MKTSTGRKLAIATLLTLLLAGSVITVGRATVPPPTTPTKASCSKIDDATLAKNVKEKLAKTMSSRVMLSIQIAAKNRVVTLSGAVTYSGTKRLAARLAAQVKCVSRIINKIKVVPVTEECDTGQQNCCCPEAGCECVPGRICPTCGATPATKQP